VYSGMVDCLTKTVRNEGVVRDHLHHLSAHREA
jgi:hypothetical protein